MNTLVANNALLPIGGFDAYMRRAFAAPILTEAQEKALVERYQAHGDVEAAKELVLAHVRFVIHIAKRYHQGFGLPWSDLVQEGSVGLMKAVKRFDPTRGVRFAAFAVYWIKAEIHDHVCKNWRLVKTFTTKAHRNLLLKKHKILKHLNDNQGLSSQERTFVAKTLGVKEEEIEEMVHRLSGHELPYDSPSLDDETPALANVLGDDHHAPALILENQDWQIKQKQALAEALASLDERTQAILQKRWLVTPKASLSDLAKTYNISIERVRQIEKSGLHKLQNQLHTNPTN